MPPSPDSSPKPTISPEFLSCFQAAAGPAGQMPFDRFVELALYGISCGYYTSPRTRIGHSEGTDFITATSGSLFGELVCAACVNLLGSDSPQDYDFIEVGAEPGEGILKGVSHPFRNGVLLRRSDSLKLPARCVVFSNELFDAQPFRRFVFRGGRWRELGVRLVNLQLVEIEWGKRPLPGGLPASSLEGYRLELSPASVELIEAMARLNWRGLFVAFDYGKSWRELIEATPSGTARAYFRHQQSADLFDRPGEQDLTFHVCWDSLVEGLVKHGFESPTVQSQEAFFVHYAGAFIAATIATEAGRLSPRKQSLLQLIHPTHMGQKFQVLSASRR